MAALARAAYLARFSISSATSTLSTLYIGLQVVLTLILVILLSAWAEGNLAEAALQLGKMVEHPNQSQPNPGLRADESPCTGPDTE